MTLEPPDDLLPGINQNLRLVRVPVIVDYVLITEDEQEVKDLVTPVLD